MEATVAERGQITLPKAVRDALGLTKGTQLKVELDGSRIILRKSVDDAVSRLRGRFKLPPGVTARLMALKPIEATDDDTRTEAEKLADAGCSMYVSESFASAEHAAPHAAVEASIASHLAAIHAAAHL